MKVSEIPHWLVSVAATVAGAFAAHGHPEFSPWIMAIVACFTHHTGKAAGKVDAS